MKGVGREERKSSNSGFSNSWIGPGISASNLSPLLMDDDGQGNGKEATIDLPVQHTVTSKDD